MRSNDDHPATKAAQALGDIEPITKSVTPPLYPATTYQRDADNQYRNGRVYGRPHNPTFETAERLLTALEGGAASLLFSSGMAAASAAFLALRPGDHVVAPEVMYWGLRNWLKGAMTEWGLTVSFVDAADTGAFARAIEPGRTKLVWLETPSNPTWAISDIAAIAKLAHAAGARVAVDSTVATPILTQPIALGADLVMHSGTKYLNGHSDVIAGTLTTARIDEYWERIQLVRSNVGAILGTFEAWLLQRGMRTLHIRVERASQSALRIAEHFASHPLVAEVLYPGLPGFAGHELARQQMSGGFGGMLSIRVKGGEAAAITVAAETRLWKRATSLGGVESLIEHRQSVEGPTSPVPPDLLRLSVGIEHADDLIGDMEQALAIAHR
ncbi:MAG TPA: aminotransferase class V-fold PLP-dependent enzyme [Aliidongia sp.]|nr:aminotransferase class V-fold PLP-dependent enzyme [Aliidongia sp.]